MLTSSRCGRALGAAAFAVGAWTLLPLIADHVAVAGWASALRAVIAGIILTMLACGWHVHRAWMPARLASLYVFGLAAGALGGAVTGLV